MSSNFYPTCFRKIELQFKWEDQNYLYKITVDQHRLVNEQLITKNNQLSLPIQLKTLDQSIRLVQPISLIRQTQLQKKSLNLLSPRILERLAYVYEYRSELFQEIKQVYKLIFDQIIDVKFEEAGNFYQLYLQEKSGEWVSQQYISDGMLKTLVYLSEVTLCVPGTVLLIDEFENGLGLNCLGIVLEEMMEKNNIQLILTSHHPYIINSIPPQHWIVVMREDLTIHSKSAAELGIGQTKYDAFFELMNRLEYEGVL